ncbi:hypothetical protein DV736_g1111, partial [Chaetothyriales sp. CBS 134916]
MPNTSSWRRSRGWGGSGTGWGSSFPTSRGFPNQSAGRRTEEARASTPSPTRGDLLIELKREDVSQSKHNPKITDCSYVASYNWLDQKAPAVVIPGKPPAWTPPATNRRLDPDRGHYYRDPNAAHYPAYPMEAAIRAVLKQNPEFPAKDIDIITCSSALGNLSRFARGVEKEFRIILASVGTTVFFVRRESSPTTLIPNVRGYGHTFPEEYTTWEKDVKNSVSHQRIIQYRFGGLHLLVRFEVDGYQRQEDGTSNVPLEPNSLIDDASINSSFATLGTTSIGRTKPTGQGRIQIKEGGHPISHQRIFDIKTRSAFDFQTRTIKKEIDLTDLIPRLWVSQIPTLVVAYHDRGLFEDIRIQDMRKDVEKWERENAENLGRLASLLHELAEIARSSRTGLEICRSESGPLEIRRLANDGVEALPSQLRDMWVREPEVTKPGDASDH